MFFDNFDHTIVQDLFLKNGLIFFKLNKQTGALSINIDIKQYFPNSLHDNFENGKDFLKCVHKEDRRKVLSLLYSNDKYLAHDLDIRIYLSHCDENWLRFNIINGTDNVIIGTVQNITVDKSIFLNIAYTAYTDDLTGLINKSRLKQKIALAINGSIQHNINSVFLIISIDNIASINKVFGHLVMNNIIQAVSERLVNTKRQNDIIARISSGKFAILLSDIHEYVDYEDVEKIGRRFLDIIRQKNFITSSGPIYITASGSGCLIPKDANTVDSVLVNTDEALNYARKRGHNSFILFKKDHIKQKERQENVILSSKIVESIEANRIHPAFQPVLNKKNPEKSFFELLARIKEKDGSLIPAYKFISIAESTGFIRMIDMQVIRSALETLDMYHTVNLSVNVSGYTLLNYSFTNHILDLLMQYKHVLSRLTVEITETVALQDIYEIDTFLDNLNKSGCRIALDDFGSGYNSFANLRGFHFDVVKIDGSYIRGIHQDPKSKIFVEALAKMSNKLKFEVVAEMVGGTEDLEVLKKYPIDYFQGFMFGKPTLDIYEAVGDMQNSFNQYWEKEYLFEDSSMKNKYRGNIAS